MLEVGIEMLLVLGYWGIDRDGLSFGVDVVEMILLLMVLVRLLVEMVLMFLMLER